MRIFWLLPSLAALLFVLGCARSPAGEGASSSASSVPDRRADAAHSSVAILAGGCFWGMQQILREVPGVIETQVGYTGGSTPSPTYQDVSSGRTGHAEAVRVVFDPTKLSYAELLESWFFRMHDPTTRHRQGNDVGAQYRSAIFVMSPEQEKIAAGVKRRVDASGRWPAPIVTEIVPATPFTPAEDYHQDYLKKKPGGYTCHYLRDWT
jgi:peptide methionine sulfoxide reductase msrA/msrB